MGFFFSLDLGVSSSMFGKGMGWSWSLDSAGESFIVDARALRHGGSRSSLVASRVSCWRE